MQKPGRFGRAFFLAPILAGCFATRGFEQVVPVPQETGQAPYNSESSARGPRSMTAKWAAAFLCQIRQKRLTLRGLPNRESGRSRARLGSVDTLAAVRNRTHIPVVDPPLDRTGSGDLESVAWYLAMAALGCRNRS